MILTQQKLCISLAISAPLRHFSVHTAVISSDY